MSEHAPLLDGEAVEQSRINKVLRNDFFNGLLFAQGNDTVHSDLYMTLRFRYQVTWSPEELASLPEAVEYVRGWAGGVGAISEHSNHYDARLGKFMPTLDSAIEGAEDELEVSEDPMAEYEKWRDEVFGYMLSVDAGWIRKGRPGRKEGQDPHRSIIREYVFGGKSTHSTFDDMLGEMRTQIIEGRWTPLVDRLAHVWQEKHPGMDFYEGSSIVPVRSLGPVAMGDVETVA